MSSSTLKHATTKLSKFLPTGSRSAGRIRAFVTASPRPLQSKKDEEEACERTKEAAEAVKESAREVRKTSEFLRDTAASTAKSVSKMTKDVSEKVSETTEKVAETAEMVTGKAKGTVSGVWDVAKNTTEMIKKVVDN